MFSLGGPCMVTEILPECFVSWLFLSSKYLKILDALTSPHHPCASATHLHRIVWIVRHFLPASCCFPVYSFSLFKSIRMYSPNLKHLLLFFSSRHCNLLAVFSFSCIQLFVSLFCCTASVAPLFYSVFRDIICPWLCFHDQDKIKVKRKVWFYSMSWVFFFNFIHACPPYYVGDISKYWLK